VTDTEVGGLTVNCALPSSVVNCGHGPVRELEPAGMFESPVEVCETSTTFWMCVG